MLVGKLSAERPHCCAGLELQVVRRPRISKSLCCSRSDIREDNDNVKSIEAVLQKQLKRTGDKKVAGPHDAQTTKSAGQVASGIPTRSKEEQSGGNAALTASQLLTFERSGHISIKLGLSQTQVLTAKRAAEEAVEANCLEAITHRIRVLLPENKRITIKSKEEGLQHLAKHGRELGFLQHFNLHRCVSSLR